jgi:hypothetical protein
VSIATRIVVGVDEVLAIVVAPRREGEDEEHNQRKECDSHHFTKDEPGGPNL